MGTFHRITRAPLFWILQVILFLVCSFLAYEYYPKAFPIVDLNIKMDRTTALQSASRLALTHHWGPSQFRQAVTFDTDSETQTFVELAAGGSAAFAHILKSGLYAPYTWQIRHFTEGSSNETQIRFTPDGRFYGFSERIPEDAPGAALSEKKALEIAKRSASQEWKIDLSPYQLAEKSHETRLNHRIDYAFVFERTQEKIGDGRYRLRLTVTGDRLTELIHFVKIPESFSRHYAEMRSANNTIATIASVAMIILYFLGGCGLGIFFLAKKRWIIWKTPLLFGVIVALFQLLEQINQSPLMWMRYDTAISSMGFFLHAATSSLISFLAEAVFLTLSFIAAESLSRRAFPHHPQLWKIWKPGNANSTAILGRTLGGYLSVGFFFFYVVFIYLAGRTFWNWWNPTDLLFHPDGLATYLPWFTSISNSLHAGFWEESLFRAIPISCAALLGRRFSQKKSSQLAWIAGGFIIQALIFASAHANYPTQPSYARVIELIAPSFLFGGIYLAFGLLPGIILHYTFDVISFSIPLFTASTPHIWVDRALGIFFTLIPLWVVLFYRIREKRWTQLSATEFNQAWVPPLVEEKTSPIPNLAPVILNEKIPVHSLSKVRFLLGISAVLILISTALFPLQGDTPRLEINREQAIELAKKALIDSGVHLNSPSWEPLASIASEIQEDTRFIWRTEGPDRYQQLIGNYLTPPCWLVRFVRFDAKVEERAEEFQVFISKKGEIFRLRHELPEERPGKALEQGEARKIALKASNQLYGLTDKSLKEVSSNASQLPSRKDWIFTFSDTSVKLKSGEARVAVRIAGDQAVTSKRFIFIPEDWSRIERNRANFLRVIKILSMIGLITVFFAGIVCSIIAWTQERLNTKSFLPLFWGFSALGIFEFFNGFPAAVARFSTEEPKFYQITSLIGFGCVKILASSLFLALLMTYIDSKSRAEMDQLTLPQKLSLAISIPTGFSAGLVISICLSLLSHFFPPLSPTWGSLADLDSTFPAFHGLNTLNGYITLTLLFSLVVHFTDSLSKGWTQRKPVALVTLFAIGFSFSGITAESTSSWLLMGLASGVCFLLAYLYVFRSHLALIPIAMAAPFILTEMKQMSLNPYPGAVFHAILGAVCILIVSVLWHRLLISPRYSSNLGST